MFGFLRQRAKSTSTPFDIGETKKINATDAQDLKEYSKQRHSYESTLVEMLANLYIKEDVKAIAAGSFLEKSKGSYSPEWLTREIIQNFVDANIKKPGTLDGVVFEDEVVNKEANIHRFTVRGNWAFKEPAGLAELLSEKTSNTSAGGNGIGLKQTALRFMRDYGVTRFEIKGSGWRLMYGFLTKEKLRSALKNSIGKNTSAMGKIGQGWLMAKLETSSGRRNVCEYIIETDNSQIIKQLSEAKDLGVSADNAFLRKPDFANEKGIIKWHKDEDDQLGRMYVNGQVMRMSHGRNRDNYWGGPAGVSVAVSHVESHIIKMSIDRPPLSMYDFEKVIKTLIDTMSVKECWAQIKKSQHIWEHVKEEELSFSRDETIRLIQTIVDKIRYSGKAKKLTRYVSLPKGKKGYLAYESGISSVDIKKLERDGYIILPDFFEHLGVEKASSKKDVTDLAKENMPNTNASYLLESMAESHGLSVGYQLYDLPKPNGLYSFFMREAGSSVKKVERIGHNGTSFRISFKHVIDKELLFHQLPRAQDGNKQQKLLFFLRGLAYSGLHSGMLTNIISEQGSYLSTFTGATDSVTGDGILLTRHTKIDGKNSKTSRVQITFKNKKDADVFATTLGGRNTVSLTGAYKDSEAEDFALAEHENPLEGGVIEEASEIMQKPTTGVLADKDLLQQGSVPSLEQDRVNASEELNRRIGAIEVGQPAEPVLAASPVVYRDGAMSADAQARIQEIQPHIPEIAKVVRKLDGIVPKVSEAEGIDIKDLAIKGQYVAWRDSEGFSEHAGDRAQYLSGKHVLDIVEEYEKDAVPVAIPTYSEKSGTEHDMSALSNAFEVLASRTAPPEEDNVESFELITAPTPEQLKRLGILREFTFVATGVAIPNDLFVFRGEGTKGLNIAKKAIGIHENVLEQSLFASLNVFLHEIAHNSSSGHDDAFLRDIQALFTRVIETYNNNPERAQALSVISGSWNIPQNLSIDNEGNELLTI